MGAVQVGVAGEKSGIELGERRAVWFELLGGNGRDEVQTTMWLRVKRELDRGAA